MPGSVRPISRAAVLVAVATMSAASARATPPEVAALRDLEEQPREPGRLALELGIALSIGVGWYWANTSLNAQDWDLHWDAESWRRKLIPGEGMLLDTNAFGVNAVRHPVAGVANYQIGRANGLGMLGASLGNLTATLVWEYVVEFKELVSLNDIVMNEGAGLAIGEPMVQLGEWFRRGPDTFGNQLLAGLFAPVDRVNQRLAWRAWPPGPRGWHDFQLRAGGASASFTDLGRDTRREELTLGVDLRLVSHRPYGRDGDDVTATRPGAWSRIAVRASLADREEDALTGIRIDTSTTYAGRYARHVRGGRGWSVFTGLGTAFTYETRRLEVDQDRLAILHALGPRLELAALAGDVAVRWDVAVYGDLGMIQAHVFGRQNPFEAELPPTSALRAHGYYYGYGGSLMATLSVETPRLRTELEVLATSAWSIDGLDRREMGGLQDPHDVTDQRLRTRAAVSARLAGDVMLEVGVGATVRRGAWDVRVRESYELEGSWALGLDL